MTGYGVPKEGRDDWKAENEMRPEMDGVYSTQAEKFQNPIICSQPLSRLHQRQTHDIPAESLSKCGLHQGPIAAPLQVITRSLQQEEERDLMSQDDAQIKL